MKTTTKTNKLCLFLSMVAFSIILLAKPMTAQAALAAPSNIAQKDASTTQVLITWDIVSGANGYDLQYSTDKNNWLTQNVTFSGTNTAIISGLTAGTTYYVQVATKDSTGEHGVFSQFAECNTAPALTNAISPKVTAATEKNVTIQWAQVTGATGYYIDFGVSSNINNSYFYGETTSPSITLTTEKLPANFGGFVFITPYRTSEKSTFKAEYLSAPVVCALAPSTPKNLKMSSVSKDKKTLEFAFDPTSGLANTDGYQVEVYDYNNKKKATTNVKDNGYDTIIASVKNSAFANTAIKFRVRAYVELSGKKYYSSKWSSYQYYVPSATCGNNLKVNSSTSATLTWKKVKGAKSYTIYYATSVTGKFKAIKKNVKGTKATVKYSRSSSKNCYYVVANSVKFKGGKAKSSTAPSKIKYKCYIDTYTKK